MTYKKNVSNMVIAIVCVVLFAVSAASHLWMNRRNRA